MDVFELVFPYMMEIISTLVIALIGIGGAWLVKKLADKTHLTNIATAVEQVVQAAQITVGELKQTTVDAMKAAQPDGKLSDEQIAGLKQHLLAKTKEKLSDPVTALLAATQTDVDALIQGAAEHAINGTKE